MRSKAILCAVALVSAMGVGMLAEVNAAGAGTVVGSVNASPNSGALDGQSLTVTGTAPSSVHDVLLIECDVTQSADVGSPYDKSHCDTNPSDEVTLPVNNNAFSGSFVFHDPLATGGAGTVSCSTGCMLLADNPTPGDVSSETMVTGNSCNGAFHGPASGSLVKTTSAGPNGNDVSPGQTITVTLTWNPSDFGGSAPSKTDDCVEIGSQLSSTLSQEHKPGPSGGTDTYTYQVPSGGTGGQPICDRGAVSGPNVSTEKSAILCYTVMGVATPEASKALLFPLSGAMVAGAGVLLVRRRRARNRLKLAG